MLQTPFSKNSVIAETDKQADIVKKLEELTKWQVEQKKLLEAKQSFQRHMLGMEQQSMYKMLGLRSGSEVSILEDAGEGDKAIRAEHFEEYEGESADESLDAEQVDVGEMVDGKEIDPASYRTLTSGYGTEFCAENLQQKPKRPFLKRGEGLKKRFNIDPDHLRLTNLPKYKYANAHPRLRLKPFNKIKHLKTKPHQAGADIRTECHPTTLDMQEQRFQNLLISSQNTCSSTPDTKSLPNTNKVSTTEKSKNTSDEKSSLSLKLSEIKSHDQPKTQSVVAPIVAWSKILDPLEIQPLQVPRKCMQTLPETEESIFELLEQKANDGSLDMNSTCLKEFMARRITEKLNETDNNILVQEHLKTKRLNPVILARITKDASVYSSDEIEEAGESQLVEDVESSKSYETTHKTIETTNSSYPPQPQARVTFSDSNETHEYEEQTETSLDDASRLSTCSTQNEDQSGDANNSELFAQFKEALFAALQTKADQHLSNDSASNTTLTPKDSISISTNCEENFNPSPDYNDIREKTEMIKIRLAELEKEIQNFKENNIVLMKAKQEHELQKSLYAQEHLEAMDSIKDEKIKMEIYLHDERVKLEEEKRQFELDMKMKTQGLVAKKQKECERLKEQVVQLEMQLKTKENNHTTAQARLRAQIRNLEREQSKLYEQIENLTRENKRLENENLKISREQNNKILLEINRNIAKLAPKQIQNCANSIPEEGPPTLSTSRTMSKCIVATAAANKNSSKTNKARFSNVKSGINKTLPTQRREEAEITLDESFAKENQQQHQMQHENNTSDIEEEDVGDILREFGTTPEKRNTPPAATQKNIKNKSPPAPPPSSPRSNVATSSNKMKREIVNADGSKDIWYPNGNLKKISDDGMIIRMLYYNKDIKETNINDGTVKYYYAETNTWHTTYLDGLEILEFPNGQVEHRHKSGMVEVHYPNNSIKIVDPRDEHKEEEWRFHDGTHLVHLRNGDKILSLSNGQKEIHNKFHKRREYPDGTVKIVYPDGSTETRYSNGRVRLKDREGNLVMDTDMAK